jgi:hypothetical protein
MSSFSDQPTKLIGLSEANDADQQIPPIPYSTLSSFDIKMGSA